MPNYLYNGVELPKLPEWDKAAYPYAYITHTDGLYSFFYEATAQNVGDGGYMLSFSANRMYLLEDGAWEKKITYGGGVLIWSNTDVYYGEGEAIDEELWGTLYLAASDPIPVGSAPEVEPKAFMAGWRMGQIVRAMRG